MRRERDRIAPLPRLIFVLILLGLPALIFGPPVIEAAAGLHALAYNPAPYFVPGHAPLLYLATPLVALSGCALLLGPGLMLAIALGRARTLAEWIAFGFTLSFAILTLGAMLVQEILGQPLTGAMFGLMALVCTLVSAHSSWLVSREWPARFAMPAFDRDDLAMLGVAAGLGWLLIATLTPKFLWESFNGDGARMFESARLMLWRPLPFWPESGGVPATWQGIESGLAIFPASWLVRLFGEYEASVRLAYVLALVPLVCVLAGLIELGQGRRMRISERILLAAALALFTMVMAFNASQDLYNADLAGSAVRTALVLLFFCAYLMEFLHGRAWGMALSSALACLVSPDALPMIGAWLIGAMLFLRPAPWRAATLTLGIVLAMMMLQALLPHLLGLAPAGGHALPDFITHLMQIEANQPMRFAWAFVPAGILPGLALFLGWRWQDRTTRAVAFAGLLLFAIHFGQHRSAPHDFAPVTILALIAYWRTLIALRESILARAAPAMTLTMLLVSLALSLPASFHPVMAGREIGTQIEDRTSGYRNGDPAALRHIAIEQALFPPPSDPRVPGQAYGGHPLVWNYYAHRADAPAFPRNYVVQPADYPPVPLARLVALKDGLALYVRDEMLWQKHASRILPATNGSALYSIPKDVLFPTLMPHTTKPVSYSPVKKQRQQEKTP